MKTRKGATIVCHRLRRADASPLYRCARNMKLTIEALSHTGEPRPIAAATWRRRLVDVTDERSDGAEGGAPRDRPREFRQLPNLVVPQDFDASVGPVLAE